jgi:hypothetical protein
MANTLPTFTEFLSESSLSRLVHHNDAHDCGVITAFRSVPNPDTATDAERAEQLRKNVANNRRLIAQLLQKKYQLTAVDGRYVETQTRNGVRKEVNVREQSLFVVDAFDRGTLAADLRHLGEEYDQDSIAFLPKGSFRDTAQTQPYLLGTNHTGFLGYGQKKTFSATRFNLDQPQFATFIKGRSFVFESIERAYEPPRTRNGHWMVTLGANEPRQ